MKRVILLLLLNLSVVLYAATEPTKEFGVRGFHIDLRSQVMTMTALKELAKDLASMKINTLVMEWEASFPYDKNATIANRYAYKPQEIKDFVSYCTRLGIDVIPLHHCFGHVEFILRHDRYRMLSEDNKEVSQVCPLKEAQCTKLFRELFAELVAYHPSRYFHIGGDETYLLGSCPKCKAKTEKEGKSKLFVDYIKAMCKIVTDMGKIPVLWTDIIAKYPEAVNELPKDIVFVDWNYGWSVNRFGDMQKLYDSNITFWGAPSIRSSPDNYFLTRWNVHFQNQKDFIPYCRSKGYKGMVMTSWSTSGLYSFLYDNGYDIQEMEQLRNNYPLSGFRILYAAYGQSLKQTEPLNPEEFVIGYGQSRFGLSKEQSKILYDVLMAPQDEIRRCKPPKGMTIEGMITAGQKVRDQLYSLTPKANIKEFDHFKLMLDLRLNYLRFKQIDAEYESDQYNRAKAKELISRLEKNISEAKELDKRFAQLNKGYLTDREIIHQAEIRNRKPGAVLAFLKGSL